MRVLIRHSFHFAGVTFRHWRRQRSFWLFSLFKKNQNFLFLLAAQQLVSWSDFIEIQCDGVFCYKLQFISGFYSMARRMFIFCWAIWKSKFTIFVLTFEMNHSSMTVFIFRQSQLDEEWNTFIWSIILSAIACLCARRLTVLRVDLLFPILSRLLFSTVDEVRLAEVGNFFSLVLFALYYEITILFIELISYLSMAVVVLRQFDGYQMTWQWKLFCRTGIYAQLRLNWINHACAVFRALSALWPAEVNYVYWQKIYRTKNNIFIHLSQLNGNWIFCSGIVCPASNNVCHLHKFICIFYQHDEYLQCMNHG